MNGKMPLMIVKTLLSSHAEPGHLSAAELDLQIQTTPLHVSLANQLLLGSRGNQLRNPSPHF